MADLSLSVSAVQINEVFNAQVLPRFTADLDAVFVRTELHHGSSTVSGTAAATDVRPAEASVFHQWLTSFTPYARIPRESRISLWVYGVSDTKKEVLLGYLNLNLLDEEGVMLTGRQSAKIWALPAIKSGAHGHDSGLPVEDDLSFRHMGPTWENLAAPDHACCTVTFTLDDFELPVVAAVYPLPQKVDRATVGFPILENELSPEVRDRIRLLQSPDGLRALNNEEKDFVWAHRHHFVDFPGMLPKFLQSVDWGDSQKQAEAHRMLLKEWKPLDSYQALELLDARYPDSTVREYAVTLIKKLSDSELAEILLQLTQVLKYEPYHDSYLARMLIERCLQNPYQLGHFFFWHLKAEMHSLEFCERYGLLLEEYLTHAAFHAVELQVQNKLVGQLLRAADSVIHLKTAESRDDAYCGASLVREMERINATLPDQFQISLNPRWIAKRLKPEKCKYMSSKKVPLWLVFENAETDGPDFYVMFKSGDDLRQDILTLQMLRMMDRMWLNEGLDLRLKPYTVIATGVNPSKEGVGMIEIVLNSATISTIQAKFGGGAFGALRQAPLSDYIRANNADGQYEVAVDNFCRSTAGYCVATYILGIGDRHNGNIMMTESGHLFHIDFGHFLGNFKSKFGFKRERSPFVFTHEMAYVMGGSYYVDHDDYKKFVTMCCTANNILRKNSALWISMFVLMTPAGMPELLCFDDVSYLRDMLSLHLTEEEASVKFRHEISSSVDDTYRRWDNAFHIAIHGS